MEEWAKKKYQKQYNDKYIPISHLMLPTLYFESHCNNMSNTWAGKACVMAYISFATIVIY